MTSTQNSPNLSIEEAQKILKSFSCLQPKLVESEAEKALVRQALLLIASRSDYENIGVCADSANEGCCALTSYLQALGYEVSNDFAQSSISGPVYIKFNTQKQSFYIDSYTGSYRGVLVSCQSSENESIIGTYGYLPLDLFQTVNLDIFS